MARPRDKKWRELVFDACARKQMTLLEQIEYPARNERILVACPHHPGGRRISVKDIIKSEHCCHTGNAQSEKGRKQRAATLSAMWDDPNRKIPLLRNTAGHRGSENTKLYLCRVKTKDGSSVLKFGRSERGAKRYGSFLSQEIWEMPCPTEIARSVEIYAHLKFSEYSKEVELETSGSSECYTDALPVSSVIKFFEEALLQKSIL